MARSDKTIREVIENQSHSSAGYKKAALASLAEILETIERIHRSQEEFNQIGDRFDEIIAKLLQRFSCACSPGKSGSPPRMQ